MQSIQNQQRRAFQIEARSNPTGVQIFRAAGKPTFKVYRDGTFQTILGGSYHIRGIHAMARQIGTGLHLVTRRAIIENIRRKKRKP